MSWLDRVADWIAPPPSRPIEASVREQIGLPPGVDEPGFRRLTATGQAHSRRDLTPLAQDYMQRLVYYLWESNPLAKWIVEVTVDFTLGEGASVQSEDEDVRAVIDGFWKDPVNMLDKRLDTILITP